MKKLLFVIFFLFFSGCLFAQQNITPTSKTLLGDMVIDKPKFEIKNLSMTAKDVSIMLSWTITPEGKKLSYNIYRATNINGDFLKINKDVVKNTFYIDNKNNSIIPPQTNIKYFYKITVVSEGEELAESDIINGIIKGKLLPPSQIQAIVENNTVKLKWVEPDSIGEYPLKGYNVFRSTYENFSGEKINSDVITTYEYVDKGKNNLGLTPGVKYFYRLQSVDVKGNTSTLSNPVEVLPFIKISAPLEVTAAAVSAESIKISWKEPDIQGTFGIAGYYVYRSENKGMFPPDPINIWIVKPIKKENGKIVYYDNIVFSKTPPEIDKTYYYKVVAIDTKGNTGVASDVVSAGIKSFEIKKQGIISAEISEYGLPPESSLTISGLKSIKTTITLYKNPSDAVTLFHESPVEQRLKVRLEGNIGKKIKVDVDYDDKNPEDEQRKISIMYTGEKEETIQEASFGDINLNLPSTRFASFSQSLFGIKLKAQFFDRLTLTGIAAQSKGIPDTQEFEGNLREKEVNGKPGVDISDTDFIKNTYYYITKDRNVEIKPGSVVVYIDDQNINTNLQSTIRSYPTGKFYFDKKILGQDYTIDYRNRVIKFSIPIYDSYIIAIAYETTDGEKIGFNPDGSFDFNEANLVSATDGYTSNTAHLIQDGTRKDISHKVMSYYYLGETQIYDPKLDNNFIIEIRERGTDNVVKQLKPSDPDADLYYEIDTDLGILKFKSYFPFAKGKPVLDLNNNDTTGEELDAYNVNNQATSLYYIHVEYKYHVSSYQLDHFPVVAGSERVFLNGQLLKKDVDYYIFYETGDITFVNKDMIGPTDKITITYEYFPFFQTFSSNLVGVRLEYKLFDNLQIGSTFLLKNANSGSTIPDARTTETYLSTPYNMYILDGDVKFTLDKKYFNYIINALPGIENADIPVDFTFTGEIAHSDFNINSFDRNNEKGVAMVDNMEGAENVLSTSVDKNYWFPASTPLSLLSTNRKHMSKDNVTEEGHEVVTEENLFSSSRQLMLKISFNDLGYNQWDAFRYILSQTGENLHTYNYLEMWIYVETDNPIKVNVDVGIINEDSDEDGILDTEDIDNTGIYRTEYDNGINHDNDPYWGAGNKILDTEDMNNNGILDTIDSYYEFSADKNSELYFTRTGWYNIKIPLKDISNFTGYNVETNPNSTNFMSLIKHLRISVVGAGSAPANGHIKIESIGFTGNSWELKVMSNSTDLVGNVIDSPDNNKFNVLTVNKNTEDSYIPNTNFFDYQRDEDKNSETALKVYYNLSNFDLRPDGKPIYYATKQLSTTQGYDYQIYKYLKFDILYKNKDNSSGYGKVFFIRLGTGNNDETNYYQYNVQLDDIPDDNNWHTVSIRLDGSDKKRSEAVGSPNLRKVQYITIGVINPNNISAEENFYINNIRLTDPEIKMGGGKYANSSLNIQNFGNLSHTYEEKDTDFNTLSDIGKTFIRQHYKYNSINFSYNQIAFLPITNIFSQTEYYTENKYRYEPMYTNNFLTPDRITDRYDNTINFTLIPNLSLSNRITFNKTKEDYLGFYDYKDRNIEDSTIEPSANYKVPSEIKIGNISIPLGNNNINSKITFRNTYTDYKIPKSVTYCVECYDQWRMERNQQHSWNGNIVIKSISLSPAYRFNLIEQKGNLLSPYIAYRDIIKDKNYVDDYIVISRENAPSLVITPGNLWIFSPRLNYSTSNRVDYSQNAIYSTGQFSLSTGANINDLTKGILPNISSYSLNINSTQQYNNTYYSDSFDSFYKLPFESQWNINLWKFIFDEKEIDKREKIAYSSSINISNNLNFSEVKIFNRFGFTPSISFSTGRTSSMRQLRSLTSMFNVNLSSIHLDNITIIGLERFTKNQKFIGDYSYNNNKTYDPITKKDIISDSTTNNFSLKFYYKDTMAQKNPVGGYIGLSYNRTDTNDRTVKWWQFSLKPEFKIEYSFEIKRPIVIPTWIPFLGGKAFRFRHSLDTYLLITTEFTRGDDVNAKHIYQKDYDLYRADFNVLYNFLDNLNFTFDLIFEKKSDRISPTRYSYDLLAMSIEAKIYF